MAGRLDMEMVLRLVNQVRGPAREIRGDLGDIDEAARRVEAAGHGASNRTNRALALGRSAMKGMALAAGLAATSTGAAIAGAASMQDAWSDANKTLELSAPALAEMQHQVDEMAVRIPVARRGLVDIMGTAGQLGIRGSQDLLAFTEDAAKMSETFDVTAGQAAEMMGSWREQMSYTQDEVRLVADQINMLGNTTAASSDQVAEYYTRVASIGDVAGLTQEEVLALGAGMIAMGRGADVAATGMQATLRTMTKGYDDLSGAQKAVIDRMGLKGEWNDIQAQMQTDASGALRRVVEGISDLDPEQRIAAASSLFGDEANRAMGSILTDIEALDRVLDRVPEIAAAAGSMEAEYLALSDDVLDNLKRVKNAMAARAGGYGKTFLDPINDGLKSLLEYLATTDQRADVFERMSQGARGFFNGLNVEGTGRMAKALDDLWNTAAKFIFGDVDADAGEVLARAFMRGQEAGEALADAFERLEPLQEAAWGNLQKLGELFNTVADPIIASFGEGAAGREALSWLAGVSLDVMVATAENAQKVYAALLEELIAFADWSVNMIGQINLDFLGDIPDLDAADRLVGLLDGLGNAVAGLIKFGGTSLRSLFGGYFDGLGEHLEEVTARLAPISESFGNIIDDVTAILNSLGNALGFFADSESTQSGIAGVGFALGDMVGTLSGLALGGIELVVDLVEWVVHLVRNLSEGGIGDSLDPIKDFFSWLGGLTLSSMLPDVNAASVLGEIGSWFLFEWTDVLPAWDWGQIIPDLPDFSQLFSSDEAASPEQALTERLKDLARGNDQIGPWQKGYELIYEQAEGYMTLIELAGELDSVLDGMQPGARAQQAEWMLAAVQAEIARLDAAGSAAEAVANAPDQKSIADVAAETEQVEALQSKIESSITAAHNLTPEIEAILRSTRDLANVDLAADGQRLMESFAAGIRSGTGAVIAAVAEMSARLDAALPKGGAVQMAVAGPSAPAIEGRRDGGGHVRRGRAYLVGERYPEIMVPDQNGTIIPPWAMATPSVAPSPFAGISPSRAASRSTTIHVGKIEVRPLPGQDPVAIARAVREELLAQADDGDDALYDGSEW